MVYEHLGQQIPGYPFFQNQFPDFPKIIVWPKLVLAFLKMMPFLRMHCYHRSCQIVCSQCAIKFLSYTFVLSNPGSKNTKFSSKQENFPKTQSFPQNAKLFTKYNFVCKIQNTICPKIQNFPESFSLKNIARIANAVTITLYSRVTM